MWSTCSGVHVEYMCGVHVVEYMWSTCGVHVVEYMWSTCGVHVDTCVEYM